MRVKKGTCEETIKKQNEKRRKKRRKKRELNANLFDGLVYDNVVVISLFKKKKRKTRKRKIQRRNYISMLKGDSKKVQLPLVHKKPKKKRKKNKQTKALVGWG
eukprot:TRINITY_DN5933_c1_g1_i2.p1 TRINITY_DN5933_c1_g1~~TRINITY_DN5933_c1_g1_i2.p1  ORF type:complete len:103 (-),score=12.28 TRINITY_DN5933_c1_g1_i2:58-366(-)